MFDEKIRLLSVDCTITSVLGIVKLSSGTIAKHNMSSKREIKDIYVYRSIIVTRISHFTRRFAVTALSSFPKQAQNHSYVAGE